jgi:Flp pilus assembly protein TadB
MRVTHPGWRLAVLALGWFLIIVSPVVGALPGPGGIFVFSAGLVLLLRNSCWARRHYVRLKRRFPKLGHACDRAMRRGSTLRRRQRLKASQMQAD